MPSSPEIRLGPWTKGVNTIDQITSLSPKALREAVNVVLTRDGKIRRRDGYEKRLDLTGGHSLFSHSGVTLIADATTLYRVTPYTWELTALRTDLDGAPLSYTTANQFIYYGNKTVAGRYDCALSRHYSGFGCGNPISHPVLTAETYGGLVAGTYNLAFTHLSASGEESGAAHPISVSVVEGGGITISALPQSTAAYIRIYVSPVNSASNDLYQAKDIPMGVSEAFIGAHIQGRRLETLYFDVLPLGNIVRYGHGRLWVAKDNVVYYSDALRLGLHEPDKHYLPPFPAPVTIIEPTLDGMYIVADRTYFLSGTNPLEMRQLVAYEYGGIASTSLQIPAAYFGIEIPGNIPFWYATTGAVLGLPQGMVKPLMADKIALAEYGIGASTVIESDGARQLITTLTNKGEDSTLAAADYASAEVRRNGITV